MCGKSETVYHWKMWEIVKFIMMVAWRWISIQYSCEGEQGNTDGPPILFLFSVLDGVL